MDIVLSLDACRRLLPAALASSDDRQMEQIRDELYAVADAAVRACFDYTRSAARGLKQIPEDDRLLAEERAAILEFDAHVPKPLAVCRSLAALKHDSAPNPT